MTPKLIADLGMIYATSTSKEKKRYGIYECPYCKEHWRVTTGDIKHGKTTQCVSCANTRHGLRGHKLYTIWAGEKSRCNTPKNKGYKNYGGRSIAFSKEFNDFPAWLKYVESLPNAYRDGYTIDRIDNDGNYEKGNLRWASRSTQTQNTRLIQSTNTSGFRGVTLSGDGKKWQAQIGVDKKTIHLGYHSTLYFAAFERDMYVIANNLDHTLNFPSLIDTV